MLDLEFAAGVPVRANGVEMSMAELIESLETIAGAHGVGRWNDGAAIIEAPAVAVLAAAHRALESYVIGDDLAALKAQLAGVYAHVLTTGEWFSPRREAIDAFAAVVQKRVTGSVRLELLKGSCTVAARTSSYAAAPAANPASPKVTA
jgi:argininosuccinate synthase